MVRRTVLPVSGAVLPGAEDREAGIRKDAAHGETEMTAGERDGFHRSDKDPVWSSRTFFRPYVSCFAGGASGSFSCPPGSCSTSFSMCPVNGMALPMNRRRRHWPECVQLFWPADLKHGSVRHHRDPVRDRHRLALVVGDENSRDPELPQHGGQFVTQVVAQGGVQRGQGFVQQQDPGARCDGAGQGHPLALPARQGICRRSA